MFKSYIFYISSVPLQQRSHVKELIINNEGKISMQLNHQVTHLLTTRDDVSKMSFTIKNAIKIPSIILLDYTFITKSIDNNKLLDLNQFIINHNNDSGNSNNTFNLNINTTSSSSNSTKQLNFNFLEMMRYRKKRVRVFISSTFIDMVKEREYITTHLMPELADYCRGKGVGVDFSFVDMRWGITREQSRLKNTIGACLSEVESSNYFVSILGNRYGWCEGDEYDAAIKVASQNHPWIQSFQGRSISELEILQATRFATKPKNVFFYFKEQSSVYDNQSPDDHGDNAADQLESKPSQDRLNRLKSIIKNNNLLNSTYSDVNQLLKKIGEDIINKINKQIPNNMIGSGGEEGSTIYELEKHASHAQSLVKYYVESDDRMNTIQKLNDFVCDTSSATSTGKSTMMVKTPPFILTSYSQGDGKSTLLAHWLSLVGNNPAVATSKTLFVAVFVGVTSASRSSVEILRHTFSIIKSHYQVATPISENPDSLVEEINYWFDIASKDGRRLVWVIDGLEKIGYGEVGLQFLNKPFPCNIKLVVSLRGDQLKQEIFGPTSETNNVSPFEDARQRSQFTYNYLEAYGKKLDTDQINKVAENHSCQTPLFLQGVLSELISIGNFETLNQKLEYYLPSRYEVWSCADLYSRVIKRWESNTLYPSGMVGNILKLLFVCGVGLYESEILATLQLTSSHGFFASARQLLTVDGSGTYLSLHSKVLLDAVHQHHFQGVERPFTFSKQELLSKLAKYFMSTGESKALSPRVVDMLPRYLLELKDFDSLKSFLITPSNFMVMSSETGRTRLIGYWKELKDSSSQDIVVAYRVMYDKFKMTNPPIEVLALLTRQVGLFFNSMSFYDAAYEYIDLSKDYHINLNGELHPSVCQDIQSLISISIKQSKFDTSDYLSEKSLAISNSIYGKDQYGTCESLMLNGLVQKKKANYELALQFYTSSLKVMNTYFGYTDSNTNNDTIDVINPQQDIKYYNSKLAELYNNLGDTYRKLANFDVAYKYYSLTLTIYKNIKKTNPHQMAEVYKNLGLIEKKKARYNEALNNYKLARDILEANFNKDHVDYALILCDIADTHRKQENHKLAQSIYNEALPILISKLSEKNIEVAEVYNNLGLIIKKGGHDYQSAINYYKKAIDIAEHCVGKSHPKYGFYIHNLGDCYRKLGNYKEAEVLFHKSLVITQSHLGSDHIEVAEILNSIGLVYKKQSKYALAEKEYKRALSIITKSLGNDHPKIGIYSNNLADIYRKLKKYDLAQTTYQKSLQILEQTLGVGHSEYGDALYGMGLLNIGRENYDEAIALIESAIEIVSSHSGAKSAKIGQYKNSLAEAWIARQRANPSAAFKLLTVRQYYQSAHQILCDELGETHPEIADVWINRAELENSWGSEQLYKSYLSKALDIIKQSFGEDHPKYHQIQSKLLS